MFQYWIWMLTSKRAEVFFDWILRTDKAKKEDFWTWLFCNTFHRNILDSIHTNIDKLELEIFWQFHHKIPLSFSMVSLWKTDVDISSLLEKFDCLDLGLVSLKNRQIKILLKHFIVRWYSFYWSILSVASSIWKQYAVRWPFNLVF